MNKEDSCETTLHGRLEAALMHEYRKIYERYDRNVYCWRRYLARLKGFRIISLRMFLANSKRLSDYVAIVDPSSSLSAGLAPGQWLIVAREDFAVKCLFMGLPDMSKAKFRVPRGWSVHDKLGLEFRSDEKTTDTGADSAAIASERTATKGHGARFELR